MISVAAALSACQAQTHMCGDPAPNFSIHLVDSASSSAAAMQQASSTGRTPPGTLYVPNEQSGGLIVSRKSPLTQACLKVATSGKHPVTESAIINFQFDENCTQIFAKFTSENIGKQFALVLNDKIIAAPIINAPITAGAGFLEGNFTPAEAEKHAYQLSCAARQN